MRDWLVSRQRYWGAPIPVVHTKDHGAIAVSERCLPVELPFVENYAPTGEGSVLAGVEEWVKVWVHVETGETRSRAEAKPEGDSWVEGERETDTMDGYACSSWYLLRYLDPHNSEQAWSPEKADHWMPLDMYVGGDHAVAHLLYVRFWSHVFHDMGLVPTKEPVKKLVYHGLIQAEDGRKMSKSYGNVVDPLEVIDAGYGADALRTFELFLGPINENSNWSSRGIAGVYRFLNRAYTLTQEYIESSDATKEGENSELVALRHRTVKKVTDDIRRLSFNTAIAALMEYVNELYKLKEQGFSIAWREPIETLVQLLSPFAPHLTAELWQQLGNGDMLDTAAWPSWDDSLMTVGIITVVVQVNGKLRAKLEVSVDTDEQTIKEAALADENVQRFLTSEPKKVMYIPGKLVSVVV
jgi:leucyl-tRNA synthetase